MKSKDAFVQQVKELMKEDGWMIKDQNGNLHELEAGVAGTPVKVSAKTNLYNFIWGKGKVGPKDIEELEQVFTEIKEFVISNASYSVRKKIK